MDAPSSALPSGTVTFLFTDIEGSTELVQRLDPDTYRTVLEQHHRILREAFAEHDGVERGTQGDAFLVVFVDAPAAVAAAIDAQRRLRAASWPDDVTVRVRMGLHSGEGIRGGDDYVGVDVNRAARIASAAHGGQILVSDATRALCERSLGPGVGVLDLGEHRLRGLDRPERLFELTIVGHPSDFPPPRAERLSPVHLPARTTTFVGRDRELGELHGFLAEDRLITLLGAGGIGKSSLAVELARATAEDFADGVWFVGLETVADPDLVAPAIVAALGLRDVGGRSALRQLVDNLAGRSLLLVIDNFEQVVPAAALLGDLLAAASGVRILVTSRAPLRLAAERVYLVDPLPIPTADPRTEPGRIDEVASVRLFVDRARRDRSSFSLTAENSAAIVEICQRLDGLPLGIELAAARVSVLGPNGIRDRLAQRIPLSGTGRVDAPARQRTLEQAVAWSHDLLAPAGQGLFARLAVFVGGWRAEELEKVRAPDTGAGEDVLDTLTTLLDQSLVISTECDGAVRFAMLEPIRQDALRRLADRDDRAIVARRHALTYLDLAEREALGLRGRLHAATLDRLATEHGNLRAAIRWALDVADADVALRLSTALTWFWAGRGELDEGRATLAAALAIPGAEARDHRRMRALEASGTLAYYSGDHATAATAYGGQLELARELGDPLGTADALFNLPFTLVPPDWPRYGALLDEAATIYLSIGAERELARTLWARGVAAASAGRAEEAVALWQESYARSTRLDDVYYAAMAANSLGVVSLEVGDRPEAARWYLTTLGIAREVGDTAGIILGMPIAALVALELLGPEPAATILGAFDAQLRRFGVRPPSGLQTVIDRADPVGRTRAALDPAAFEAAWERGAGMTPEESATFVLGSMAALGPITAGPGPGPQ